MSLAKKYTLWTVTARQKSGLAVIESLIKRHIPNCIKGIHCVWENRGNGVFYEFPKKEFIKNIPGEKIAFFDDSPSEILKMQDLIKSFLFDPTGIYSDKFPDINNRVRSWKQIGELLL